MIERVGKEFPTLFICVRERVRPAPLEPKDGLVVGPAAASLRLSSALPRYRRAKSLRSKPFRYAPHPRHHKPRFWPWGLAHTGLSKSRKKWMKTLSGCIMSVKIEFG